MASNNSIENHSQATIGAGALVVHDSKVLLVQMNYGPAKGAWILPGGMVESKEHPSEAAAREVFEETQLAVHIHNIIGIRHRILKTGQANIYYVFQAMLNEKYSVNPEAHIKWPENELLNAKFWDIERSINSSDVRPLTAAYIRQYQMRSHDGLKKGQISEIPNMEDEFFCL